MILNLHYETGLLGSKDYVIFKEELDARVLYIRRVNEGVMLYQIRRPPDASNDSSYGPAPVS